MKTNRNFITFNTNKETGHELQGWNEHSLQFCKIAISQPYVSLEFMNFGILMMKINNLNLRS